MGCLHSKYIFVNYDKWQHRGGWHKVQETVCFQNMLKIENIIKTLWICSQDQWIIDPFQSQNMGWRLKSTGVWLLSSLDQWDASIQVTWSLWTNQRPVSSPHHSSECQWHQWSQYFTMASIQFMIQYIEIISAGCLFVTERLYLAFPDLDTDLWLAIFNTYWVILWPNLDTEHKSPQTRHN